MESLASAEEAELILIKKLTIEPEVSQLEEGVNFTIAFTTKKDLINVRWTATHIVDYAGKRMKIEVYKGE